MQLSMILSTTLAVLAAAAPEVTRRGGGGGGGGSCNADVEKQVCCDGILSCVVQALSSGCSNTSFCCKTDAPIGALISISALNCVQL